MILKMASQKRLKKEDWRKEAAGYIGETGLWRDLTYIDDKKRLA